LRVQITGLKYGGALGVEALRAGLSFGDLNAYFGELLNVLGELGHIFRGEG